MQLEALEGPTHPSSNTHTRHPSPSQSAFVLLIVLYVRLCVIRRENHAIRKMTTSKDCACQKPKKTYKA